MEKIPHLQIGKWQFALPIVQGGMGVRISGPPLVAAVANQNCVGTLTTIGLIDVYQGIKHKEYIQICNDSLTDQINKLRTLTDKPFAVNVMGALSNREELIQAACQAGAHIIVYGAGIPKNLPDLVSLYNDVALVPIISSARLAQIIINYWDRYDHHIPDAFIIEGPLAGGHLGFSPEQLNNPDEYNLEKILLATIKIIEPFEQKIGKKIPLIVAGGIYTGSDIAHFLSLGASGVQLGTRFVATHECPVHLSFKQAYIAAREQDIMIIKSPVGMPGRAIRNPFLIKLENEPASKTICPYYCIDSCKRDNAGYCIAEKLINSFNGELDDGLIFSGANVHRIDKILSIKELIDELKQGILDY
jgi:NAD(P)H-dependent flavin oxidoreductase YrpB (nitropropane dioxygenase family)